MDPSCSGKEIPHVLRYQHGGRLHGADGNHGFRLDIKMLQRLIGNAAEVVGGGRHDQRQPLKLLGRDLIWVLVGIPRIDPGGSQMEFSGNDQQELFQGQLFGNVLRPRR